MGESVILAVGGGAADAAAIDWVARRAETRDLAVRIVSVLDDAPSSFGHEVDPAELANARLRAEAPRLTVTAERVVGHPFDVLSRLAESVDLMVLGAGDPAPLGALLHLGLPARLAGHVECDLVVVPGGWQPVTAPVVVGWEDDDASAAALERATEEARHLGVPLLMAEPDEERSLAGAVGQIRASAGASLLVVGAHHRGPLARILFGTTDDALVTGEPQIPVLVVGGRRPAARA